MIPKYRAWSKYNRKMYSVLKIDFEREEVLLEDENGVHYEDFKDGVQLMQHTNLVDRFGIDIYEGDKVINGKGEVGIVIYLIQEAGWVVQMEKRDYRLGHRNTGESYPMADDHAVIGHMYEEKTP